MTVASPRFPEGSLGSASAVPGLSLSWTYTSGIAPALGTRGAVGLVTSGLGLTPKTSGPWLLVTSGLTPSGRSPPRALVGDPLESPAEPLSRSLASGLPSARAGAPLVARGGPRSGLGRLHCAVLLRARMVASSHPGADPIRERIERPLSSSCRLLTSLLDCSCSRPPCRGLPGSMPLRWPPRWLLLRLQRSGPLTEVCESGAFWLQTCSLAPWRSRARGSAGLPSGSGPRAGRDRKLPGCAHHLTEV